MCQLRRCLWKSVAVFGPLVLSSSQNHLHRVRVFLAADAGSEAGPSRGGRRTLEMFVRKLPRMVHGKTDGGVRHRIDSVRLPPTSIATDKAVQQKLLPSSGNYGM